MLKEFIKCGLTGWSLEVFWTGLHSCIKHDRTLKGTSSLLMFPIYGAAFLIKPLSTLLKNCNAFIRGCIYALGIFSAEYTSGIILKKLNACPWDYNSAKLNYKGVIRFDYLPLWFIVGLMYEKMLQQK